MIEYERLGLSDELKERFKNWIKTYDENNLQGNLNHVAFNSEGLALAYELYIHLNKENHVEFQGESEDVNLEEPIDISSL